MTSASPLRGAIIGYGNVAANGHMPFWRDAGRARIAVAVDSDPDRRMLFEQETGGRAYADFVDMLDHEALDFIDICTSPASHMAVAEQALTAGLHVLCEKPLTIAAADSERLVRQANAVGRVVHCVHNWLEAPVSRAISALVDDGVVGAVRSVEWETLRTQPAVTTGGAGGNWRLDPVVSGGGILIDHGWHALYCVAAWAGAKPHRVRASLENRRFNDLGVEDTATVDIDFGPATARVHLSWAAAARMNTIAIVGTQGRLDVADAELTLTRGDIAEHRTCPPSLAEGSHHPDWFAGVGRHFLDAVDGKSASNLADALRCSRLIEAAQRSSARGGMWTSL